MAESGARPPGAHPGRKCGLSPAGEEPNPSRKSHHQDPPTTHPYNGRPKADSLPGGGRPRGHPSPRPPGFPRGLPRTPRPYPLPAQPGCQRHRLGLRQRGTRRQRRTKTRHRQDPHATGTSGGVHRNRPDRWPGNERRDLVRSSASLGQMLTSGGLWLVRLKPRIRRLWPSAWPG
jgi:hypothetical protein